MNTYPVTGYRTKSARARGFQTKPRRHDKTVEDIFRRALAPPWGDELPPARRRAAAKAASHLFKGGAAVITRHPVFRAAQLAWEAKSFLHDQMSTAHEGGDDILLQGGWEYCWGPCYDHTTPITHQYEAAGTGTCDPFYCAKVFSKTGVVGAPVQPNSGQLYWMTNRSSGTGWVVYAFRRIIPTGDPNPTLSPQPITVPARPAVPVPAATPMPTPWRLAPHRPNSPFREAGYSADPAGPPQQPPLEPSMSTEHRPPGRGQRERKFRLMGGGWLRNAVEAAFEGVEQIGIFHGALPKECQAPKGATAAEKFAAVWACADQLDGCDLLEGQINNMIEDQVVGALGQAAKKSAQGSGKAYGLSGITKRLGKPTIDPMTGEMSFDPTLPFEIPKVDIC